MEIETRHAAANPIEEPSGLGRTLISRGVITEQALQQAMIDQRRSGERLDQVLLRLGLISPEQALETLAEQLALPIIDLNSLEVDPEVLRALPARQVFRQRCVPIERRNGTLRLATCDPFHLTSFDELRLLTGLSIELALADERDLRKFIRAHYGVAGDTLDELTGDPSPASETAPVATESQHNEIEQAQEASVIKLVNDLLAEALRERATDVHIEPYEETISIRYRIDGLLAHAGVPPTVNRFRHAIISRLKIMANLNIAEKRKPQDGRIALRHRGEEYDLRVSVIPMLFGEGVVLRILNKCTLMFELEKLGMEPDLLRRWDELIRRPHGILLVTGPTGSGKSTTLYASLKRIVSDEVKAITIEDPVEYHVDGVNQIQVHPEIGLTFAGGLRAVLRHDPDIIMIGEIRDQETAKAAVQASLTGHLVLSTLHTNDAAGAITRLLDMRIEPFLVASTVEGVMAQRLVRRICPVCKTYVSPGSLELPPDLQPQPGTKLAQGEGCRECRHTGYRGRLGIYELLKMTDPTRELVMSRANARRIVQTALEAGQLTLLRMAGYETVRRGETTLAEVLRVTKM